MTDVNWRNAPRPANITLKIDEVNAQLQRKCEAIANIEVHSPSEEDRSDKTRHTLRRLYTDAEALEGQLDALRAEMRAVIESRGGPSRLTRAQILGGSAPQPVGGHGASERRNADGTLKPGALLAEARAISTGDAALGAALTPADQAGRVWQVVEHKSAVLAMARAMGATFVRTERSSIMVPREEGSTLDLSAWYGEAAQITPTDPDGDATEVVPRKIASLVVTSDEAVSDSEPALLANLEGRLLRSLALRADHGFVNGTNVAPQPAGLASLTIAQATAVNAALADLDPFAAMLGDLLNAGADEEGIGFLLSPRDWAALIALKESATSNRPLMIGQSVSPTGAVSRTLYGRPVALTPAIPTNGGGANNESAAFAVYWPGVIVVERALARVEVDTSALFDHDQVMVRAKTRLNYHIPDVAAVATATGIRPA
jgi:HK97 family phage major capsid protein